VYYYFVKYSIRVLQESPCTQRNDAYWLSTFPSGIKCILSQTFYEITTCKNVYPDHAKEVNTCLRHAWTITEKYFISGLHPRHCMCT
jgi:hypothetical protein